MGVEIWFRTDKKCGRTDGMDGRSQNYIPPTSPGDKKKIEKRERGIEKVRKKEGKSDLASDMNDSCADHYLAYNFFVKDFSLF